MSEDNEGDEGKPDKSGSLAGWLLNDKQKSFIRALLQEDDHEEPDADSPPDKTLSTAAAFEAILLFSFCYFSPLVMKEWALHNIRLFSDH